MSAQRPLALVAICLTAMLAWFASPAFASAPRKLSSAATLSSAKRTSAANKPNSKRCARTRKHRCAKPKPVARPKPPVKPPVKEPTPLPPYTAPVCADHSPATYNPLAGFVSCYDAQPPACNSGAQLALSGGRVVCVAAASAGFVAVPAIGQQPASIYDLAGPVQLPSVVAPAPTPSASALAWWASPNGQTFEAAFRNGQCTDLAELKRPDIVMRSIEAWYDRWVASGYTLAAQQQWAASFWDGNAAAVGMAVGATPRANAIMVMHSHDYPAWPGHVAWVQSVNPDGSFTVLQEHAPTLGVVVQTTYPAAALVGADIDFIY
jgi:CHAP domain